MFKEAKDLDQLVELHSRKTMHAKHYSRQLTMGLALVCLVFFGTIVTFQTTATLLNNISGMVVFIGTSGPVSSIQIGFHTIESFITAVKSSPQLTLYKLFFYSLWILAVLVGSMLFYEWKEH